MIHRNKKIKRWYQIPLTVTGLLLAFALSAQAGSWQKPVAVGSTLNNHYPVKPLSVTDNSGNVVILWREQTDNAQRGQVWARSRSSLGAWSAYQLLDANPDNDDVQVAISAKGDATAVWTNSSGIWSADKPLSQPWTMPKLLVSGKISSSSGLYRDIPKLSMNSTGYTLLAWNTNNVYGYDIKAIQRWSIQNTWSAPETIAKASSPYDRTFATNTYDGVKLAQALVGENGDMLVAWYRFGIHPHGFAGNNGWLTVSRRPFVYPHWQASSKLGVVFNIYPYKSAQVNLLLDALGHAGVIFFSNTLAIDPNKQQGWSISTQPRAGTPWSKRAAIPMPDNTFCPAYAQTGLNEYTSCLVSVGTEANAYNDRLGNITFIYKNEYLYEKNVDGNGLTDYSQLNKYKAVIGNLSASTWSAPSELMSWEDLVSPTTPRIETTQPKYDVGLNGKGLITWTTHKAGTNQATLKTLTRSSPKGKWLPDLSFNFQSFPYAGDIFDVNLSANGNAAVLFANQKDATTGFVSLLTYH